MTPLAKKVFELFGKPDQPPWPCPHCGGLVRLEPAAEEHAPTRFWTCPTCGTWGATREGAAYPAVWVSPGGVQ